VATTDLGFAIIDVTTMVIVALDMFFKPTRVHSIFDYWWPVWLGFAFMVKVYEHNFGST
jgi:hypothetical protein